MAEKIRSYKELLVWQKSILLTKHVYIATRNFPREEIYGLISQLRRAVASIPANIAEGAARNHRKEFLNFLGIASGSGAEVETLLLISKDLEYVSSELYEQLAREIDEVMRMLNRLRQSLRAKSEPPITNH